MHPTNMLSFSTWPLPIPFEIDIANNTDFIKSIYMLTFNKIVQFLSISFC